MACVHPNEEWTVFTTTDTTSTRAMLVFCLGISSYGRIKGTVNELPIDGSGTVIGEPIFLGKVKGHQDQTTDPSVFVMTLDFRWGRNRVIMAGIRFASNTPNTFNGRFSAFTSTALAAAAGRRTSEITTVSAPVPADGDTGTATGTQT